MSKIGGNHEAFKTNTGHYSETNVPKGLESKLENSVTLKEVNVTSEGKVEFSKNAGIQKLSDVKIEMGKGDNKPDTTEKNWGQKIKAFFEEVKALFSSIFSKTTTKTDTVETGGEIARTGSETKTDAPKETGGQVKALPKGNTDTFLTAAFKNLEQKGKEGLTAYLKIEIGLAKKSAETDQKTENEQALKENREPKKMPGWEQAFGTAVTNGFLQSKGGLDEAKELLDSLKDAMVEAGMDKSSDPEISAAVLQIVTISDEIKDFGDVHSYVKGTLDDFVSSETKGGTPFRLKSDGATAQAGLIRFGAEKFQTGVVNSVKDNMLEMKESYAGKTSSQLRSDTTYKKETLELTKAIIKECFDGSTKEKSDNIAKMFDPKVRDYAMKGLEMIGPTYDKTGNSKWSKTDVEDAWKGSVMMLRNICSTLTDHAASLEFDTSLTPDERQFQSAVFMEVSRTIQSAVAEVNPNTYFKTGLPKESFEEFKQLSDEIKTSINNVFDSFKSLSGRTVESGTKTETTKPTTTTTSSDDIEFNAEDFLKGMKEIEDIDLESIGGDTSELNKIAEKREKYESKIGDLNMDILELEQSVNGDIQQFEPLVKEHYNNLLEKREDLRSKLKELD